MLHILSRSPYQLDYLEHCVPLLAAEDAVLLIEDAVYALHDDALMAAFLERVPESLYLLEADLRARGLARHVHSTASTGCQCIDYAGFVRLSIEQGVNQSW